jgi:hypothetical protein
MFHQNSLKLMKAVIQFLPGDTSTEEISSGLRAMGYIVIRIRHMMASQQQSQTVSELIYIPLILAIFNRKDKSQETFKLTNFSHVVVKVEAYRVKTGLKQCYSPESSSISRQNVNSPK